MTSRIIFRDQVSRAGVGVFSALLAQAMSILGGVRVLG